MNKFNILGKTFTEGVWSKIKDVVAAKPEDRLATLTGTVKPSSIVKKTVSAVNKTASTIKDSTS